MSYASSDEQSPQSEVVLGSESSLLSGPGADDSYLDEFYNDALGNVSYSDLEWQSYHRSVISQLSESRSFSFTGQSINIVNQNNKKQANLAKRDIDLKNIANEESDMESQEEERMDLHEAIIQFMWKKTMLEGEREREITEYLNEEIPPNY